MGISDPLLNQLARDLVNLSQTKATQLLTQTEQHPQIVKLNEQIVTTKKALLENVNNLVENAQMSLNEINRRISALESESRLLPSKQQQLINYQRNYKFNDDTYKYLMQRRAEAQILRASNTPDNEILDEARLERTYRISPRTSMNYLIAILLGLLIPALYLFLKSFFNNAVTDRKDVEKLTSFPIIGQVGQTGEKDPLLVINNPKSPISESFRSIRTNVEFITRSKLPCSVLVTGDAQGIGKTFNSINIASIYALYGKKTVLLGFDMRKPKLFQEFGITNNVGLSSFLSNQESIDNIIQNTRVLPNLDVIPSGHIPPNPAEMIASDKCTELFDELKKRYDYIVIDTPPLGLVTDAFLLMRYTDANIFIVRQGHTNKNIFGSVIKDLEDRNANIAIVINGVETCKSYGYGKYSYGYGYGYGYGYDSDYYGEEADGKKKKHRSHKSKQE
jgi:capsular exopolysaccharide synthesis family protein